MLGYIILLFLVALQNINEKKMKNKIKIWKAGSMNQCRKYY